LGAQYRAVGRQSGARFGHGPSRNPTQKFYSPRAVSVPHGSNIEYDSGDYEKSLAEALRLSDYENLIRQRDQAHQRGELVGVGLPTFVLSWFLKITLLRESNRSRGLKV